MAASVQRPGLAGALFAALLLAVASLACSGRLAPTDAELPRAVPVDPDLPPGFPVVPGPPGEDGVTPELRIRAEPEKVELGRRLFYDARLSGNGHQRCATCHRQELAFADGRARALGSTGEVHTLGAMSLTNVAYNTSFGWARPDLRSLEEQALVPLLNEDPVEMGMAGREAEVLDRLRRDRDYEERFRRVFGDAEAPDDLVTLENVVAAIAAFERTLISGSSPFDRRVLRDERGAMSESAERGMALFASQRLGCSGCHGGLHFAGEPARAGRPLPPPVFHRNGIPRLSLPGGLLEHRGVEETTGDAADRHRFRAPTLRNIEVTAPYMHDGRLETLEDVIDHYAEGAPEVDERLDGFELTAGEREDLVAFLHSLTDQAFLTDPRFSDPFEPTRAR